MTRVTLTFDNGPSPTTRFVLDELERRGLHAYFCLVGTQLQKAKEHVAIAQDTLRRGHRIVNHSLTHSVALGDDPTAEHAQREIADMHELMCEYLGEWGEPWFRPFGRGGEIGQHLFSTPALCQLQAFDYSVLLWNCVPRDWENTDGWVDTALQQIEALDHAVVVVHDLGTGAMLRLPEFLDRLNALDVEFSLDLPATCIPVRAGETLLSAGQMARLVS